MMHPHEPKKHSDDAGATKPGQAGGQPPMPGGASAPTPHKPLADNERRGGSEQAEKKQPQGGHEPVDMNKKPGHGQPDPLSGQRGEKPTPGGPHQGDHKGQNPGGSGQKR
jgi:hypothetical protein